MIRLSVLDQSPIREGRTAAEAIEESLVLAQACDGLGFHRYWLAEHHNAGGLAGSAPEILIGRIAQLTTRLRVGAGGIMLNHYSALKVAESFRVLEALYPGRIDLGIGRAPGSDGATARALAHGPGALGIEHFPSQINDVVNFINDTVEPESHFHGVHAEPRGPGAPEIWLLGSSDQSAAYAAHFGLPFSFAHFIDDQGGEAIMQAYMGQFQPSKRCPEPVGSVGVFVICAETDGEAKRLALSRDLWLLRLRLGRPGPVPSPEEAEAYPYTAQEMTIVEFNRQRTIAGDPAAVRARLEGIAEAHGVGELVVVTITHDFEARCRSYALLAEAFGLGG
jgi:luciferase family oxidoreductase group 1